MRVISDVKTQKRAIQIRYLLVFGTVLPVVILEFWINRKYVKTNELKYQV
jgi:hypothetical protein